MSFKYEEDRAFIVASKGEGFISAYGAKFGTDLEIEAKLKPGELYHAFCFHGKFHVYNDYVRLVLTAEQLDLYFKEPFIGVLKD